MVKVTDVGKALEIYYSKVRMDTDDISELFGGVSRSTVCKLKQQVRVKMLERGVPIWDSRHVDTKTAFETWGIDVEDLEKRFKKLRSLGFFG